MSNDIRVYTPADNAPATTRWLVEITAEAEVVPGDPKADAETEGQS